MVQQTKTKNWNKKTRRWMMSYMAASLIAPVASLLIQPVADSLINSVTGKEQKGVFLPLLASPVLIKVIWKGSTRTGRW